MKCPSCSREIERDSKFCPRCGVQIPAAETTPTIPSENIRQRRQMGRGAKTAYTFVALGLFALALFTYVKDLPGKPNPVIEKQPEVAMSAAYAGDAIPQQEITSTVENGNIVISLPLVMDKKIVAFDYDAGTTIIPLLAYINTQGKLVTAIRLCEPCNSKTFRIEGNELACGNCETHWKLDNLEGLRGNCQQHAPDPIPSTVNGNKIYIDEQIVKNWKIRM